PRVPQSLPRGAREVPRDDPRRLPRRPDRLRAGRDRPALRPVPGRLPGPKANDPQVVTGGPKRIPRPDSRGPRRQRGPRGRELETRDVDVPQPAVPGRPPLRGDPAGDPPQPIAADPDPPVLDHPVLHRPVPPLVSHEPAQGARTPGVPDGALRTARDGDGAAAALAQARDAPRPWFAH